MPDMDARLATTKQPDHIVTQLLQAIEARAQVLGLPNVRLSVRLALVENRAYYERAGYQFLSYGTHAGYSAPTYVTLEKHLA